VRSCAGKLVEWKGGDPIGSGGLEARRIWPGRVESGAVGGGGALDKVTQREREKRETMLLNIVIRIVLGLLMYVQELVRQGIM
jgi:hypothetical protein